MMTYARRLKDKKSMKRRHTDTGAIHKFDLFIESRASIVLNWFWKSGLILFISALVVQNLSVQKNNSDSLVTNTVQLNTLTENSNKLVSAVDCNSKVISDIKLHNKAQDGDIKYLRRDVDGLMMESEYVEIKTRQEGDKKWQQ